VPAVIANRFHASCCVGRASTGALSVMNARRDARKSVPVGALCGRAALNAERTEPAGRAERENARKADGAQPAPGARRPALAAAAAVGRSVEDTKRRSIVLVVNGGEQGTSALGGASFESVDDDDEAGRQGPARSSRVSRSRSQRFPSFLSSYDMNDHLRSGMYICPRATTSSIVKPMNALLR
jgi:hypothetical protein